VLGALTLRVRPEVQEDHADVGRAASEAEAGNREGAVDFRETSGDGAHLLGDVARIFQRSSGGSLDNDEEISLIFGGDKGLRHVPEDEVSEAETGDKQDQGNGFETQKSAEGANIAIGKRGQEAVDALE